MKIYRKKLSKASLIYGLVLMPLIVNIYAFAHSYGISFSNFNIFLYVIIVVNLPSLLTFFQFNYITIGKSELVIGNGIYTFLKYRYTYTDISKVVIGQGPKYYAPYIQLFTHQKKSRKFMLILVHESKFKDIVRELQELNIPVDFDLKK